MSRLLLDSHIFVWYLDDDRRLPVWAGDAIKSAEQVYLSSVSVWELSIKIASGKMRAVPLVDLAEAVNLRWLTVTQQHAQAILTLPRHHKDPFDHMLLAQAKVEGLTLVTHDAVLAQYGVSTLLV